MNCCIHYCGTVILWWSYTPPYLSCISPCLWTLLHRKLWLSIVADTVLGAGLALLVIPVYPDLYGIAQWVVCHTHTHTHTHTRTHIHTHTQIHRIVNIVILSHKFVLSPFASSCTVYSCIMHNNTKSWPHAATCMAAMAWMSLKKSFCKMLWAVPILVHCMASFVFRYVWCEATVLLVVSSLFWILCKQISCSAFYIAMHYECLYRARACTT